MKTFEWKKLKEEALRQLAENTKRIPILEKRFVKAEAIGSAPRAMEFTGFREEVTEKTIETPYLRDYYSCGREHEDMLKHRYLLLVSEDMPSARKCGIQAANHWRMEQEESGGGFYYTE